MRRSAVHVAVTAAISGYGVGLLQTAQAQSALEEMVVTATRREENLQEVPLAVVAFSTEALDAHNVENIEDLNAIVPNVLIRGDAGGPQSAQFNIRGIPNVGTYIDGIWQVSNLGLLQREFVEIERVEVLRGPQGTLYGRDSTGGSIHLFTQRPADEFGATIDLSVGSYDRTDVRASVDIPFSETFRSRFTVGSYDHDGFVTSQTTGFKTGSLEDDITRLDLLWSPSDRVDVRITRQEDAMEVTNPRVEAFIAPEVAWAQGFQVGVAEAYDIASGGNYNPITSVAGYPGGQLGEYESRTESTVPDRQELDQTTLSFDLDITDNIHFKYLYGDTDVYSSNYLDWDGSQYNFFVNYNVATIENDSHELQFSGGGDRLSWVGGYYTWDQEDRNRGVEWAMGDWIFPVPVPQDTYGHPQVLDYADVLASPACTTRTPADVGYSFPGNVWPFPCNAGPFGMGWVGIISTFPGDRLNIATQDGFAYFGEVTLSVTDRLELTVGARHHDQDSDNQGVNIAQNVASGALEPRPILINTEFRPGEWAVGGVPDPATLTAVSFDADTYRFAVSYQFTDNAMAYVGYNEGFNSGGISTYVDSCGRVVLPYDPETIENTEIGLRSDLFDGRLRMNATYFDTDWVDIQLTAEVYDCIGGAPLTEVATQNAASANASGVELELSYAATDRLLLQANLGFLDTEYTSIKAGAPVTLTGPRSEFAGAPDETYNLGIQYDVELAGGGRLMTRFDANYWGAYWRHDVVDFRQNVFLPGREPEAGDIWVVNARLAYRPADRNYEVALWGNNLTNEYNYNSGFMHGIWQFDFASVDRPREAGVTMKMFF